MSSGLVVEQEGVGQMGVEEFACDLNLLKNSKRNQIGGIEMFKKLIVFLITPCFLLSPVSILAQQKGVPAFERSSSAFKSKKNKAETKIKEIESLVGKIAKGKRVSKGDAENLDRLMNEHVKSVNDAVKQAFTDAEEAKKSNGKKGSVKSFIEFENMAKKHEKRAKAVEAKLKKIEAQIKEGDVELDKPLIESMTPAERKEYMKNMTPKGREKMKKKHPELLSHISIEADKKLVDMEKIGESVSTFCKSFPEEISNFIVSPAEAAIGATAGATCAATNVAVVVCAAAIALAVVAYASATDNFDNCMQGQCSCRWYKPWCCTGRTGCWVAYLVICA